jgi:dipeptidyl aminopeptidase/acylaminoacyl peptidase
MSKESKGIHLSATGFAAILLFGAGVPGSAHTAHAQEAHAGETRGGADADPEVVVPGAPSFRDVLGLKSAGSPRISPDGSTIAYTVSQADWAANRWDTEIWLAREGGEPFQLTRTAEGSSFDVEWSPDGRWISFLADRGDDQQLFVIRPDGGEAIPLTASERGVRGYDWSPDGSLIAVTITEPQSEEDKEREEEYGAWEVEDAEHRMTHLWLLDVRRALDSDGEATLPAEDGDEGDRGEADNEGDKDEPSAFRRLTGGEEFTVGTVAWSPDGRSIAFDHRPDPAIPSFAKSDLSLLDVETGEITSLVERPAFDGGPMWSPDGEWILFRTANEDSRYFINDQAALVSPASGEIRELPRSADRNCGGGEWTPMGVRVGCWERTHTNLYELDLETGEYTLIADTPRNLFSFDYTPDGRHVAFTAATPTTLTEIYRSESAAWAPERVTDMTGQVSEWPLGTREVVQWTSEDGTEVEGVLFLPEGYDPNRAYPTLVIIHGGPSGIDWPVLVESYVYPVSQWLAKGAVVFQPNYRGSIGYGQDFRALNYRNLGVGDAWDVESGVQHLIDQGIAHPDSLGAMGWSQGGYISAFLTTTSDNYKAISVGAGISNWMTYYVNTDIHPFTRHYLGATPWEDPDVYAKTSPMTYINDAQTPTLIQHGENDARVPIPNAYELYQGLQDVGVETKLIVYKDFGHGITRPKERLAAMWHNWGWFGRHIWDEDVEMP